MAGSGDENKQKQQQQQQLPPQQQQEQQREEQPPAVNGVNIPQDELPPVPVVEAWWPQQPSTSATPGEAPVVPPARSRRRRRPLSLVWRLSVRALRLWRRQAARLLKLFAARPLGQRALEAVGHTIATAERATRWAAAATDKTADREPVPVTWYAMMPIVMALMVIRTGAGLAETYLNVQLPRNRQLVNWLERRRINLEELRAAAAANIRKQYVDESDAMHSFLNTWPFNIPYKAAQQLGIIPVRVTKQPSESSSESTSVHTVETLKGATSLSGSSTLTEAEDHAAPSSTELTPPAETAADKTLYFSPDVGRLTKEETEEEEPQDDKQEVVQGEKDPEEKTEEASKIAEEEVLRAAMAVVDPLPSAPPEHLVTGESEKAASSVEPPPSQPASTSEDLLAAERASGSEPGPSSTEQKATSKPSKAPKTPLFLSLLGLKLA